ncbi:T9SS type A sorting domain-containing protein [Mariniflexile sp. HNIBRBA6329]|uniref:T9SS type A sorting domain-containing protein n=1 Tax=Mariniflexile sp. HNIBRBA6329 TaxID=3373088 RepID=UPI0037450CE2
MTPQMLSKINLTFICILYVAVAHAQITSKTTNEKSETVKNDLLDVFGSAGLNNATNEIDMAGEVSNDTQVLETGFVYSTSENLPTVLDTKIAIKTEKATFSNTLTNLLPNTIYYIRPYAITVNGTTYGSLSTIDTSTQSSIDVNSKTRLKTYPNPSTSFISLSGLMETKNYIIYNMAGKQLAKGNISYNNKIDVRFLENGMYLLKLDDFEIIRFIKE